MYIHMAIYIYIWLCIGSGKTTLMRTLAGISESSAIIDGTVKLDGKEADENLFGRLATFIQQTVHETCLFRESYAI